MPIPAAVVTKEISEKAVDRVKFLVVLQELSKTLQLLRAHLHILTFVAHVHTTFFHNIRTSVFHNEPCSRLPEDNDESTLKPHQKSQVSSNSGHRTLPGFQSPRALKIKTRLRRTFSCSACSEDRMISIGSFKFHLTN